MEEEELRSELEGHHPAAYGWALHCCGRNPGDAEDVLQTAYVKILGGRARFNGGSSFRTWLFAVIRNTAADQQRSWWRRLLRESGWSAQQRGAPGDARLDAPADYVELENAMMQLSNRQREVLHLTFYQGMTVEEAAEVMSVSVGSARTHYERGKARLRSLLNGVLR
ncbi:MAG: RNA polymerase sigma factor [Bryobacterales bacterium]|nr:RNA polymerase sigma factor [Bryobacterales bacterium]MDE0294966.1 RNA polymerase sigma factor [Bryobacterales bacterium]MDE0434980.1 RNA polymerase sigma factor [Bryobacterales bacterium]